MRTYSFYIKVGLVFGFFCFLYTIENTQKLDENYVQKQFAQAELYKESFQNDRALIILDELVLLMEKEKKLLSPMGLRIQLRQAEALERDDRDEEAISKLLYVAEQSESKESWGVYADAYLSLARLYEKLGRGESCLTALRTAENAIYVNVVDSLYPRFSIRLSSYHRIYDNRDSSLFYAKEVLRTAPNFNLFNEEAVGNLLLGLLLGSEKPFKAIEHFEKAGNQWLSVGDYSGYHAIMHNIASIYLRNNKLKKALEYADKGLYASDLARKAGDEDTRMESSICLLKAKIFKESEQMDSAYYYQGKGYELDLAFEAKSSVGKVLEIDAKYQDEKKAERIEEQNKQLKQEKKGRVLLVGTVILISLLLGLLALSYMRIKKANELLNTGLQEQYMLQGEVHHRVKNNLQVIISLLDLQMDEMEDPKHRKSLEAMSNRIYSMSAIHDVLYRQEGSARIVFYDYVENLCKHFSHILGSADKTKFELNLGAKEFNMETSMPLGIIVTELLTNSLKYATQDDRVLEIKMSLEKKENAFHLIYKDNGSGFPDGKLKERSGALGAYLLKSMTRQLNGKISFGNDEGALIKIQFKEKNNVT